jgi:hypothetical protein
MQSPKPQESIQTSKIPQNLMKLPSSQLLENTLKIWKRKLPSKENFWDNTITYLLSVPLGKVHNTATNRR